MREIRPVTLALSAPSGTPVLLLRDVHAARYLPIWIGHPEAQAIALAAQGAQTERPLTHTLIVQVIHALGQRLREVVLTELQDDTFHAELLFDSGVRVSARPSDAVALALTAGSLIHAEDTLLNQAGLTAAQLGLSAEAETSIDERDADQDTETQLEQFRAFLDQAHPEDFGPGESTDPEN